MTSHEANSFVALKPSRYKAKRSAKAFALRRQTLQPSVSITLDRSMPSAATLHASPAEIGWAVVSVPVLIN